MVKERVKTLILILLLLNCVFLTYRLWFGSGMLDPAESYLSVSELPFVRYFSNLNHHSVPKENLSKPRKIVINDGSLWIPYYNTDDAFATLAERTEEIVRACLRGEGERRDSSYTEWLENLNEQCIYVEYPIEVTPRMLAMILGEQSENFPSSIDRVKDVIIIPSGEEKVEVAVRDVDSDTAAVFSLGPRYAFPEAILAMYANENPRDGYYEFAFSTLLSDAGFGSGNVVVDDLVLFSDNYAEVANITAANLLSRDKYGALLKSFSLSAQPLRHYQDEWGCENYVENYATVRIYPDGYVEYSAVDPEKGIYITGSEKNEYETLNSAIDFAERVWSSISDEPLNVLVSGIEADGDGRSRFTFDYYYGGREVAIKMLGEGRDALYHAIEIETVGGRITSYRQYMRGYSNSSATSAQESFVSALDYLVTALSERESVKISDIYPGYYDDGTRAMMRTTWLAAIDGSEEIMAIN